MSDLRPTLVRHGPDKLRALAQHWETTFFPRVLSLPLERRLADLVLQAQPPLVAPDFVAPSAEAIEKFLPFARFSASGTDGVSYFTWARTGRRGMRVLR